MSEVTLPDGRIALWNIQPTTQEQKNNGWGKFRKVFIGYKSRSGE